jgi:uncharacterized delta-60 repeat protein
MIAIGTVDPTFHGKGVTTEPTALPVFGGLANGGGMAVVFDGHELVGAGWFGALLEPADFVVVRYLPTGGLDPSFGGTGYVVTDFHSDSDDHGRAVVVQPDGSIVVAGDSDAWNNYVKAFALARYYHDGTLDNSFGNGGKVTASFGEGVISYGRGAGIQTDGKIVVGGSAYPPGSWQGRFALARFEVDGGLDTSFGDQGRVLTLLGGTAEANALAIQPDGAIVLAGYVRVGPTFGPVVPGTYRFALARYLPDGQLDPSFGVKGKMATRIAGAAFANALALDPGGRIVLAGWCNVGGIPRIALARYEANGFLDTSFGANGIVISRYEGDGEIAYGVQLQADGKIVIAGEASLPALSPTPLDYDFAFARYHDDGNLDASFGVAGAGGGPFGVQGVGGGGIVVVKTPGTAATGPVSADAARAVVIQPDGRLVALGFAEYAADSAFAAVRLE